MKIKDFLLLIRFQYFVTSLLPMLLVFTAVLSDTRLSGQLLVKLLLVSLIILLLHTAANLVNDYYDAKKGCDLQDSTKARQLIFIRKIFSGCYLSLIPVGIALAYYSGWTVLFAILLGAAGSYIYTATDWSLKYHSLGEAANLFFLGPAVFASVEYALTGGMSLEVFFMAMIMGFFITTILTTNNLRDIDRDRAAEIKTMVTNLGYKAGTYLLALEIAAAFLFLAGGIYLQLLPLFSALVFIWLPRYIINWRMISRTSATTENVMRMVQLYTFSGVSLLLALILDLI